MSEIPDDIRETAMMHVAEEYASNAWDDIVRLVATALMAERERCAKIAESEPAISGDVPDGVLRAMEEAGPIMNVRAAASVMKRSIAASIRRGTTRADEEVALNGVLLVG